MKRVWGGKRSTVLTALKIMGILFFSSRRRHTRYWRDWSSDVCSSDLILNHSNPSFAGILKTVRMTISNMRTSDLRPTSPLLSLRLQKHTSLTVLKILQPKTSNSDLSSALVELIINKLHNIYPNILRHQRKINLQLKTHQTLPTDYKTAQLKMMKSLCHTMYLHCSMKYLIKFSTKKIANCGYNK